MQRASKLKSLSAALAALQDGMEVATGGWIFNSQPMALVREVVRRGLRNLRLVPAPGSIAPDMLIGAGCVSRTACVFISFEQFGLAPHFRRAAEAGTIEIREMDGPAIAGGLRAGATDLPYMLIPDIATDLPRVNPECYRPVPRRPGERPMFAVPAIQPDLLLLHGQQADEYGNVQLLGGTFFDPLLAQAAKRVVVTVDRIVDPETIRRDNHLTKIPAAFVDAVVEAPFGAHPTASAGFYGMDEAHLADYVTASADEAGFRSYLDRYVNRAGGHPGYVDQVGRERLRSLCTASAAALGL
ncbi:MAG: CoA transferase subunit A [Stellaceae bacterium]